MERLKIKPDSGRGAEGHSGGGQDGAGEGHEEGQRAGGEDEERQRRPRARTQGGGEGDHWLQEADGGLQQEGTGDGAGTFSP